MKIEIVQCLTRRVTLYSGTAAPVFGPFRPSRYAFFPFLIWTDLECKRQLSQTHILNSCHYCKCVGQRIPAARNASEQIESSSLMWLTGSHTSINISRNGSQHNAQTTALYQQTRPHFVSHFVSPPTTSTHRTR